MRCPRGAKKLHNLFVIKDINFSFFLDDSYEYLRFYCTKLNIKSQIFLNIYANILHKVY
jgi:hypothetical protein